MSDRTALRLSFVLMLITLAVTALVVIDQRRDDGPSTGSAPSFESSRPALPDWPAHHRRDPFA